MAREALSKSAAEERHLLQSEVDMLKARITGSSSDVTQMERDLQQVTQQRNRLQEDIIGLKEEALKCRQDLENQISALNAANTQLEADITNYRTSAADKARLRSDLEALQKRELEWLQEKERCNRLLAEAHNEVLQLKSDRNDMEAELLQAAETNRANEKKNCELELASNCKSDEFKELEHLVSELQAEKAKLEKEKMDLMQQPKGEEDSSEVQKKLKGAVAKLRNAQEAMEGVLTCMSCMEVFQSPMTYIPCGHTFCKSCVESAKERHQGTYTCEECGGSRPVKSVTSNSLIDEIAGKFVYQKQVLSNLAA